MKARCIVVAVIAIVLALAPAALAQATSTAPSTAPASAASRRPIVCVTSYTVTSEPSFRRSLLVREIVRQAVLMAARDGLGAVTRDGTLRERSAEREAASDPARGRWVFDVEAVSPSQNELHVRLYLRPSAGGKRTLAWSWDYTVPAPRDYVALPRLLVPEMERAARGPLVEALKKTGVPAAPVKPARAASVDDETEARLWSFHQFAQFAALRSLHERVRNEGESPALLEALARGYANLGQLTQFFWSAMSRALTARSLLYAERALALSGGEKCLPLWTRAYVLAMAGRHADAAEDLQAAAKQFEATPESQRPARPAWVDMIDAACRYDTRALLDQSVSDAREAPLAAYLCFLSVENAGSPALVVRFAGEAYALNNGCVRLLDAVCGNGGISVLHQATLQGPQVYAQSILTDLPALPGVPVAVQAAVKRASEDKASPASRAAIARALVEAGDVNAGGATDESEPSWGVLGRMMQETFFAQARRRAYFLAFQWGVGPADVQAFATAAGAMLAEHPCRPIFQAYAYASANDFGRAQAHLAQNLKIPDPVMTMTSLPPLVGEQVRFGYQDSYDVWLEMYFRHDDTAWDLECVVRYFRGEPNPYKTEMAKVLQQVSPSSPLSVATLIADEWALAAPHAAQWEKDLSGHPAVARAFAIHYTHTGDLARARRMWEKSLELDPEVAAFMSLAELYLKDGDEARYLATMQRALEAPDSGLEHAQVRVSLARHFMQQGDYLRAEPLAEQAAQTWAQWAMECAAECAEGLGKWDHCALWMQRVSERYGNSGDEYLRWCVRTGHGDATAAARPAGLLSQRLRGRPDDQSLTRLASIALLSGDKKSAEAPLKQSLEAHGNAWSGMMLVLSRHRAGDPAGRDAALSEMIEKASKSYTDYPLQQALLAQANIARQALSAGTPSQAPVMKAYEALSADLSEKNRSIADYFAGRVADMLGSADEAVDYFKRSVGGPDADNTAIILAHAELRRRGIDPLSLPAARRPQTQPHTQSQPQTQPSTTAPAAAG